MIHFHRRLRDSSASKHHELARLARYPGFGGQRRGNKAKPGSRTTQWGCSSSSCGGGGAAASGGLLASSRYQTASFSRCPAELCYFAKPCSSSVSLKRYPKNYKYKSTILCFDMLPTEVWLGYLKKLNYCFTRVMLNVLLINLEYKNTLFC